MLNFANSSLGFRGLGSRMYGLGSTLRPPGPGIECGTPLPGLLVSKDFKRVYGALF